jgi:4-amino-4-deoxy-L-arabinose transferase-like glycosyltransferase
MDVLRPEPAARADSTGRWLLAALLLAALVRLVLLGAFPLTDETEARYGEIAREMLATGDWITPQLNGGSPFWAKPPLSIWFTASSLGLFGITAFAARLPHFLAGAITCMLVYGFAGSERGAPQGLLATTILATTPAFFISSGAVMTDAALVLGTTLAMIGFWRSVNHPQPSTMDRYGLFFGLAVGLLAKGPVALVLTLLPAAAWAILAGRARDALRRIPWMRGTLLMTALALPWYLLAEARTPGFLDYFLIGEHWRRFTEPGWTGDLYGYAHASPRGTIWLYALLATSPWCLLALAALAQHSRRKGLAGGLRDPLSLYLTFWVAAPLLFFTLSRNVVWTYVLPGVPALALLVAQGLRNLAWRRPLGILALATAVPAGAAAASAWLLPGRLPELSQYGLVARYFDARPSAESKLLYVAKVPYSAQFYGNGSTRKIESAELPALTSLAENLLAVRQRELNALPAALRERLEIISRHGEFELVRDSGQPGASGGPDAAGAWPRASVQRRAKL